MKVIRIVLLALIILGAGLLFTQNLWVPKLVGKIMERESVPPFVLVRPVASSTEQIPKSSFLPYGEVTLRIGDTARFSDLTLTPIRVFEDSRCPIGVNCIWEGRVKAEVEIVSGLGTSTSAIEMGGMITTEAEEIIFLSATPHPKVGVGIPSDEYRLTFRVEKKL